tara:strand:- start:1323 stop:1793 length:471 start_codon:yes stop_codon:yes gene_type:complete
MESNLSLVETKEILNSGKSGKFIHAEFSNECNITGQNSENIFFELSIKDIETIMWLLDEGPQLVFAISGRINNEFDDYATILLGFKDNRSVVISSNWVSQENKRGCNIITTQGKISLDMTADDAIIKNQNNDNARKVTEAALLSSQKGIPIYLELK